jgi:hypothetical protein
LVALAGFGIALAVLPDIAAGRQRDPHHPRGGPGLVRMGLTKEPGAQPVALFRPSHTPRLAAPLRISQP